MCRPAEHVDFGSAIKQLQIGAQIDGQIGRILIAQVEIFVQRLADDALQLRRDLRDSVAPAGSARRAEWRWSTPTGAINGILPVAVVERRPKGSLFFWKQHGRPGQRHVQKRARARKELEVLVKHIDWPLVIGGMNCYEERQLLPPQGGCACSSKQLGHRFQAQAIPPIRIEFGTSNQPHH